VEILIKWAGKLQLSFDDDDVSDDDDDSHQVCESLL
jgi:hypothetical protein